MAIDSEIGIDLAFSDDELPAVHDRIRSFIVDRIDAAGADRAVLGLSGGIDSTLVAHLAVDALGADRVHGLVLPSTVSQAENMSDAERVATDLGLPYDVIEIDPFIETLLDGYPDAEGDEQTVGNARARTRAVLMYMVANHEGGLVLGTGNRTEALVGYFTKYGDGAVDCHPIGDLYKQQVRQLARHLGVRESIVTKPPTAGLWAGQTDEEELGLGYDAIDPILALTVDGPVPKSAAARLLDGVTLEDVEHVHELYERSAHKRELPPSPEV